MIKSKAGRLPRYALKRQNGGYVVTHSLVDPNGLQLRFCCFWEYAWLLQRDIHLRFVAFANTYAEIPKATRPVDGGRDTSAQAAIRHRAASIGPGDRWLEITTLLFCARTRTARPTCSVTSSSPSPDRQPERDSEAPPHGGASLSRTGQVTSWVRQERRSPPAGPWDPA